jgi:predicted nucleic acid-binding Zn ribbon protein
MATYAYECRNENCKEQRKEKTTEMSMNDYSEDKLPMCSECGILTNRVFTPTGVRQFDGINRI